MAQCRMTVEGHYNLKSARRSGTFLKKIDTRRQARQISITRPRSMGRGSFMSNTDAKSGGCYESVETYEGKHVCEINA